VARIRSIHPGFFSDPEFAALSDGGQIIYLGLLTEADDNGVFEWNLNKLKIRLRPLKDGSIEPFVSELVAANKVASYEFDGRKYGAIRNFRRFQRPKSPKSWHPIPDDFRNYVGLSAVNGGNELRSTHPTSEIPPQREEEGGKGEPLQGSPPEEHQTPSAASAREPFGGSAHDASRAISTLASRLKVQ
jgi:hypothetical protein